MEAARRRCVLYWLITVVVLAGTGKCQLVEDYYAKTCPTVETLVKKAVDEKVNEEFASVADTLRLFFHDCFVEGCDASVMIESPTKDAEKDAPDNKSLDDDGFEMVMDAKKAVESVCPGVVSCADILAIATRDVVVKAGGPWFSMELGRRDGLISQASRVTGNIPQPTFNLNQLNKMFAEKNLTQYDMIALSGVHTIGVSHCNSFANRMDPVDSSLNPEYAKQLMDVCNIENNSDITVNMDPDTPNSFDNTYYKNLLTGKGLFTSDVALNSEWSSLKMVKKFANNPKDFNAAFAYAMRKLGRTGVKIGMQGEVRRDCTKFN